MRTALICIEQGDPVLSLDDAKAHLRVDGKDEDAYITDLCAAANDQLDGDTGWLKRALGQQSWRLVLDGFEHCCRARRDARFNPQRIDLPLPPLQQVTAVKYLDGDGNEQTLDAVNYRAVNCGSEPSFIMPAAGKSWPSHLSAPDAVRVEFTAGYGNEEGMIKLPRNIVAAMKLLVGQWYEQRMPIAVGTISSELPNSVRDLLWNQRIINL